MAVSAFDYLTTSSNTQTTTELSVKETDVTNGGGVDDASSSLNLRNNPVSSSDTLKNRNSENIWQTDLYKSAMHGANIFSASEVKEGLYSKTYRFGYRDQYNSIYNSREYLFFTKPELNIIKYGELGINGESDGVPTGHDLNPELATIPFWIDLKNNHPDVIRMLEGAYDNPNSDNTIVASFLTLLST
jgi:hypothetical protein